MTKGSAPKKRTVKAPVEVAVTEPHASSGRRMTLGMYLLAVIGLQALLFAMLTVFAGVSDFGSAVRQAANGSGSTARLASEAVSRSIGQVAVQVGTEASMPGYRQVVSQGNDCSLTPLGTDAFASGDIHLMDLSGNIRCSSYESRGNLAGRGYQGSAWLGELQGSQAGFPVIAGPLSDPVTGHESLVIAARVSDASLILVASLDVTSLPQGLAKKFSADSMAPSFLILSADRSKLLAGGEQSGVTSPARFREPLGDRDPIIEDLSGVDRIYGEFQVQESGWGEVALDAPSVAFHVWAGVSTGEALTDARESLGDTFLLGLGALLVVLVVGVVMHRRITRPVRTLASAVDRAAAGDLTTQVPTDGPRELANLGESFNNMLQVRSHAESALVDAFEAERNAGERLRELDQMKTSFLLAISHELRTPLTAVVGYAGLLDDPPPGLTEQERKESTSRLYGQARRLERLLGDLLDIERMSRGTVEAHRKDVPLRELVMRVVEQIAGAEHRVRVKVANSVTAFVDAALMERVIENLIVNAMKHTPADTKIWVTAKRSANELIVAVEDSGPGVPDDLKPYIFEPFRQGDVPDHAPGTGIGLALVAQFAKLHGARAWVDDRPGGGAAFRLALPVQAPKRKNSRRTAATAAA